MSDVVTFGETMLRLSTPSGERLETADALDLHVGGAESNVAVAAARMGADAVWLSKLPETPLGRRIVRELRAHGVRTGVVWTQRGRVGTYYVDQGGAPRGTEVIYDRADSAVTSTTVDELPTGPVRNAGAFYTSGITPALSERLAETTLGLLRLAQDAGVRTAFDLNYRSKLWSPEEARRAYDTLLPYVDVLVAAERDVEDVLGREGEAIQLAHGLSTDYDVETVVLTRGAHGSLAVHGGEVHEQRAYEADTYDPIGSGDAFVGAFLATQVRGGSVPDALARAAAAASLKRTLEGDLAVVTPEEVDAVVAERGGGVSR